jgi:intracellular septation protein
MKQLIEFIPIVLFFAVYQMDGKTLDIAGFTHTVDGIFSATAVLIIATLIQLPLLRVLTGHLEKRLLWTSAAVVVFGMATLLLRNELFIQWKPSVLNWAMAVAFAGSQFIGERNLLERLMGSQLALPRAVWRRVCWVWVVHFNVVAILNLVVAYEFSEATWVAYKLYSSIGFTLFIMIITIVMISPALKHAAKPEDVETEFRP